MLSEDHLIPEYMDRSENQGPAQALRVNAQSLYLVTAQKDPYAFLEIFNARAVLLELKAEWVLI